MARSDWGVDTVITYATAAMGLPIYEHNVPTGKRHALYGSLADIRTMLVECLGAVKSLRGLPPPDSPWESDPPAEVPEDLKQTVAYDATRTAARSRVPSGSSPCRNVHTDSTVAKRSES